MKRLLLASAVVFVGCLHAREVEREEAPPREEQRAPPRPAPKKAAPPAAKEPEVDDGRPHLSPDAEGLLKPEGPRLIQEALSKRGYLPREHLSGELDVETSNALRRFQADEHAPRTGYPDRETVRKLGLEVEKVFKSTGARSPGSDR